MLNENVKQTIEEIKEELTTSGVDGEKENQKEKRKSQADKLIELVNEDNCKLFHDQFNEPYAHLLINDHWETWKLKSKQFRRWLCSRFWESDGKAANSNGIISALTILEGKACFNGEEIILENRVAYRDGEIWYDLANKNWQAVKITPSGWEIVDEPLILFRRYSHQQAQVIPVTNNGDLKRFNYFVNLAQPEELKLLLVYIVSCFIPDIAHPIPILYGPQGAAKTTLGCMLRSLIDPSSVGVLSMPTSVNDLTQKISHNWFAFFDNVTSMADWASDSLCRAVTGEGFSKRELYSDDDDVIYNFRRCIGLNGINVAAKKPDLLDRGILLKLDRISGNKRKSEKSIWKEFRELKPVMLGGIFDALSRAMKLYESIKLDQVPRMADFTIWGCAIAEALGFSQDKFLQIYYTNIDQQNDEAIEESPVAMAILFFMAIHTEWEGSPSTLFEKLEEIAGKENLDDKWHDWPGSVSVLSRRINEIKANLAEKNIYIESRKGSNGQRTIRIEKTVKNTAEDAALATPEKTDEIISGDITEGVPTHRSMSPPTHYVPAPQKNGSGASGDIDELPF